MQKIIIFGANRTGQEFYKVLQDFYKVIGIIDRNIEQFKGEFTCTHLFKDISVVPQHILAETDQIIIASSSIPQNDYIKSNLQEQLCKTHINITSIYDHDIFKNYVNKLSRELRVIMWKEKLGDLMERLDYPELDSDSIVFDLGGYRGQWASDIYAKYGSNILIFEPVREFSDFITERFNKNNKIRVFNCALGKRDEEILFHINKDESGTFNEIRDEKNDVATTIISKNIISFLKDHNINKIELIKINIEGGEYDLLDYLIESNWIQFIDNIQVQFHDFVPNAEKRIEKIQESLKLTHYLTYEYKYVWENWKRRKEVLF